MTRRFQQFFVLIVAVVTALPLLAQSETDPFYLRRLEAGKAAWTNGEYQEAVDQLRIASFGLLDDLDLLSETLARLAIAQQAAGLDEAALATMRRFVDVEAVARSYGSYRLPEAMENALATLLKQSIPNDRLGSIPTLARFHTSEEDRLMGLSGRDRTRALEQMLEEDPQNPRWYLLLINDAIQRRSTRDARGWVSRGLEAVPGDRTILEMSAELELRERDCLRAWSIIRGLPRFPADLGERVFLCLLDSGNTDVAVEVLNAIERVDYTLSPEGQAGRDRLFAAERSERERDAQSEESLPQVIQEEPRTPAIQEEPRAPAIQEEPSAPVIQQNPQPQAEPLTEEETISRAGLLLREGRLAEAKDLLQSISGEQNSRALDLALLEVAVLSSDWNLARQKIRLLTPFRRSEPVSIFYAAVTLYESNRIDDARRLFEYARPMLSSSELVDRYERLILGTQ